MNFDTTLEQPPVEGPTVVAPPSSIATPVALLYTTTMPYSIRLRLALPTTAVGTDDLAKALLAIRDITLSRHDGTMRCWREGRPEDGAPPDPYIHVLLSFEDNVSPLEIMRALRNLDEQAVSMALDLEDVE